MATSAVLAIRKKVPDGLPRPSTVRRARVVTLLADQQPALVGAVNAYRAGSRSRWAPVILALMARAVERRLSHLHPVPPVISSDDLRQQLLVEVLEAALAMPLPQDPRVLERAILRRASQAVSRRLSRELRRQQRQERPVEEET